MGQLTPTAWYTPTPASGPIPCRWEGWVNYGGSLGVHWVVITLYGD